tara:strand:+ start:4193 stop:4681 length:489 start_codon:yes stop_codon:yes gene_type:complete
MSDKTGEAPWLAKNIMKRIVYSASPDTSVAELADQLKERGISAVPVVDETGQIVGIVSKGDLLRQAERATQRWHQRWLRLFSWPNDMLEDSKTQGLLQAKDLMTREVVTISEDTPVNAIADLLEERHIKRVPVVRDGKVIGMVSHANLLFRMKSIPEKNADR